MARSSSEEKDVKELCAMGMCSAILGNDTLTFTDDYSQYTTVYFIKSKSEVLLKFQKYVNSVEKHTGHQISFIKRYMGSSTST